MIQNRGPKGVWAALGRLWGSPGLRGISGQPPGRLLGSSWAVLEASWAFWVALGPSWAPSWGVFGGLGGILEAPWSDFRTKMEPSWYQNVLNRCYVKTAQKLNTSILIV